MAEPEEAGNGDGSKARVTVELVGAKLDTIAAVVAGHAEATNLKLDAIRDKIAPLAELPDRVTRLEGRMTSVEDKAKTAEDNAKEAQNRRMQWPTIVFGGIGALAIIVGFLTQLH